MGVYSLKMRHIIISPCMDPVETLRQGINQVSDQDPITQGPLPLLPLHVTLLLQVTPPTSRGSELADRIIGVLSSVGLLAEGER